MKRTELQVSALKNGTVIDHIPSGKVLEIISLLKIDSIDSTYMIAANVSSKKMGSKSLIKVKDRFFTDEELNQLSVVAPEVTLSVIKDYDVVEKKCVTMPDVLKNIVKCQNPKCITNNEPMHTIFHVINKDKGIIKCQYCEKEQSLKMIKLK